MSEQLSAAQAALTSEQHKQIFKALGFTVEIRGSYWYLRNDPATVSIHHGSPLLDDWKWAGEVKAWLNANGIRLYRVLDLGEELELTHVRIDDPKTTETWTGCASDLPDALCRAVLALLDARPELGGEVVA